VTLEHDAFHEELTSWPKKHLGLKQDVANQQKVLQEALARATEVEKECPNFMENIECYH
jgi:hypothetical protein